MPPARPRIRAERNDQATRAVSVGGSPATPRAVGQENGHADLRPMLARRPGAGGGPHPRRRGANPVAAAPATQAGAASPATRPGAAGARPPGLHPAGAAGLHAAPTGPQAAAHHPGVAAPRAAAHAGAPAAGATGLPPAHAAADAAPLASAPAELHAAGSAGAATAGLHPAARDPTATAGAASAAPAAPDAPVSRPDGWPSSRRTVFQTVLLPTRTVWKTVLRKKGARRVTRAKLARTSAAG
jgi:hypothetical protein